MWSATDFPATEELPDLFLMGDGSPVRTRAEWAYRREELTHLLSAYQYGHMPPSPGNVVGTVTEATPVCDGRASERRITLRMALTLPKGTGPFPVVIKNDVALGAVPIIDELVDRGYGAAEYLCHDLDPDEDNVVGPAQAAYPDLDWGTLAAWAWGTHRVVDYLVSLPEVDATRLAATGHSRGGKAALLAGATDQRIALTAPNGSGTGGAGCYRVFEGETLEHITRVFPYWFQERLGEFVGHETRLPFDQHFLKALVAPRALLCTEAADDRWANPRGTQQTTVAAQEVFEWLGAGGRNVIHMRDGDHDQLPEDWRALLDFADVTLRDRPRDRPFTIRPFPELEPLHSWSAPM